jgi:hypothetical protein
MEQKHYDPRSNLLLVQLRSIAEANPEACEHVAQTCLATFVRESTALQTFADKWVAPEQVEAKLRAEFENALEQLRPFISGLITKRQAQTYPHDNAAAQGSN